MLASTLSRKLLAFLLVVVGGLLVATLYRMEVLSTFLQHQQAHGTGFRFWQRGKVTEAVVVPVTSPPGPILESRDEQVRAGNTLHQLLIKDPVQYKCRDVKYIKNKMEGAWKYCGDTAFALTKPCLVYSFGINYDFTFDDALGNLGCDVFSFDPSMNTSDHRRNPHVTFYHTGLGGQDTDSFEPHLSSYVKQKTTWKMRTLKTLLKELGHSDRTIDLLKIDIESSEWPTVRNILNTAVHRQVKQLLIEWHVFPAYPARQTFQQLIDVLRDLREAGFRSFDKHPHPVNLNWSKFNLQSDIGYVNVNFLNSTKH